MYERGIEVVREWLCQRAVKGVEVGVLNAGHVHFTCRILSNSQSCEHDSEREKETADLKNMNFPRSPPPLRTSVVWPSHIYSGYSVWHCTRWGGTLRFSTRPRDRVQNGESPRYKSWVNFLWHNLCRFCRSSPIKKGDTGWFLSFFLSFLGFEDPNNH